MRVVIRIGGSVIASPTNPKLIDQYIKLLRKLRKDGHEVITVVGGGALARELIKTGSQLGLDERAQDWLAIHVSRLYALLFALKLGRNGTKIVPTSTTEALEALSKGKIVVMGGLKPGITTDTVAAYAAQRARAQLLVKATDQDGIYTRDPKKHEDARKLDTLTFKDLAQLLEHDHHKAGIHQILDPVAIKILQKTNTKTIIVNGHNPQNVQHAIEGKKIGTTVRK
jgi:uridylate kinase